MSLFRGAPMGREERHRQMMQTPIPRLLLTLSVPTVLGQLVTVVYNAADTYFVSQLNTSASAAVGVVFSLMSIIHAIGFGISMGAGSIISRLLGEKRYDEAGRYASSAFFLAALAGFLILGAGLPLMQPLMKLLGASDTMMPYAVDYGKYIVLAAPLMCTSFVLNNVLRAEGETRLATIGMGVGSVLNVGLDPLFIFTFGLGIEGAAIATALSQLVSFLLLLSVYLRGRTIVKLKISYISKKPKDYFLIFSSGFPTICRQGMASLSSALLNIQARAWGDAAVAAVTIANKVYMLVRNVVLGVGQGFQPIAGYNYGAGNRKRTREVFRCACIAGTVICIFSGVLIALFAGNIMAWFRDDPEVIRLGKTALLYACAVMPFMGYSTYVNQLYQCLGYRTGASLLASMRQGICFVPLILVLPRVIGFAGVQVTQPGADFITFLVSIPFCISFFRRHLSPDAEATSTEAQETNCQNT